MSSSSNNNNSSSNRKRTLVRRSAGSGAQPPTALSSASSAVINIAGGATGITSDDLWQTMNSGRNLSQPQPPSKRKRTTPLSLDNNDDDDNDNDDNDDNDDDDNDDESDLELPRRKLSHSRRDNRRPNSARNPVDTADENSDSEEDRLILPTLTESKKRRHDTSTNCVNNRAAQPSQQQQHYDEEEKDATMEPIVAMPPQPQLTNVPLRSTKVLERQQLPQFQKQQPPQFQQQPQQFQQQPPQFQQQQQQQQQPQFQQQQQRSMQPQSSSHPSQSYEAVQMAGVSWSLPPSSEAENELLAQWFNVESIWRQTSSNRRSGKIGLGGLGRKSLLNSHHATHRSATMDLAASMNSSANQNCWAMLAYVDVDKCIARFQLNSPQQMYEMYRIVANLRRELLTLCDYAQRIGANVNVPPRAIKDARKLLRADEQKLRAWDERPDQLCDSSDDEEDRQQYRRQLQQKHVSTAAARTNGVDGTMAVQGGADDTAMSRVKESHNGISMVEEREAVSRASDSSDDSISEKQRQQQQQQNVAFDENMLEPWGIVISQDDETRQQGLLELVANLDQAIFELMQCIATHSSDL